MAAPTPTPVTHNLEAQRFEAWPEGRLAQCAYRRQGPVLVLHHTEVPPQMQGQGLAAALVAAYMRRHPETQDLLEALPARR